MEILNKAYRTMANTYHVASIKTEVMIKKMRLNSILEDNQERIEEIYNEIGKIVYQKHLMQEDDKEKILYIEEELANECSKIDSLAEEMVDTQKELLTLDEKKLCKNCQKELEIDANFCSFCGAEQTGTKNQEESLKCFQEKKQEKAEHKETKRGRPAKPKEEKQEEEKNKPDAE